MGMGGGAVCIWRERNLVPSWSSETKGGECQGDSMCGESGGNNMSGGGKENQGCLTQLSAPECWNHI